MNEHILIVEDDEHLAMIVRDGLSYHGYTVSLSTTGADALSAIRIRPPALVVLDVMLPDLDGIDICQRLRASAGPPIIMLTARDAIA
ncbi:MAG: response regulator, partial [Ktedonobacterales bacterium]|nr:response regulator [Ktedonobacterales bacterium]